MIVIIDGHQAAQVPLVQCVPPGCMLWKSVVLLCDKKLFLYGTKQTHGGTNVVPI